ncbi:MAG TPA: hypothetical protein VK619_10545 [Pyrinomonadaceae bacterium]|nr:hypothetical protein [Pyrinomonadaceae bacterium]
MVTITNLEVHFDVEGEGDQAVFAKMFEKHIRMWSRMEAEAKARKRLSDSERALGDRSNEGEE